MNIPQSATPDVQQAFRELWQEVDGLTLRNVDMKGKRLTNAGDAILAQDYVTKAQLEKLKSSLAKGSLEPRLKQVEAMVAAIVKWFETGSFDPP